MKKFSRRKMLTASSLLADSCVGAVGRMAIAALRQSHAEATRVLLAQDEFATAHPKLGHELRHLAQRVHVAAIAGRLGQCGCCVGRCDFLIKVQGGFSHLNPSRHHDDPPVRAGRQGAALTPGNALRVLPHNRKLVQVTRPQPSSGHLAQLSFRHAGQSLRAQAGRK